MSAPSKATPRGVARPGLWARIVAALPGADRTQSSTRIGMLNTGELVLLDDTGRAEVVSAANVRLLRAVLAANPPSDLPK